MVGKVKKIGNTGGSAVPRTTIGILGSFIMVTLGATMKGEWMLIAIGIYKEWEQNWRSELQLSPETRHNATWNDLKGSDATKELLNQLKLQNVHWFVLGSIAVSLVSYFSLAGFFQYYFYIRRKEQAHEWKCQPERWLTKENERHEILMGSLNMVIGATVSGMIAAYLYNGGESNMYFSALERGWQYLVFSTVALFLMGDGLSFYIHKSTHYPFLYKHIHKWHHRYHSPTAFSATAMHPLEFIALEGALVVPIFIMPVYSGSFIVVILYNYYYGMIDHSGIKMDALWPWQPPSMFHDNHHKYFHTNFGFNTLIWDWLHDTLRRDDRVYGEDIFYGKGKPKIQ